MPHITIELSGTPDAQRNQAISKQIAQLTQDLLGKAANVISITLRHIPEDLWWIDGQTLAATGKSAFYLGISITDETNTKAEKAAYLQAVYEAMASLLPRLHEVSYVHLVDARAAAYGYGGKTQEFRYQHR